MTHLLGKLNIIWVLCILTMISSIHADSNTYLDTLSPRQGIEGLLKFGPNAMIGLVSLEEDLYSKKFRLSIGERKTKDGFVHVYVENMMSTENAQPPFRNGDRICKIGDEVVMNKAHAMKLLRDPVNKSMQLELGVLERDNDSEDRSYPVNKTSIIILEMVKDSYLNRLLLVKQNEKYKLFTLNSSLAKGLKNIKGKKNESSVYQYDNKYDISKLIETWSNGQIMDMVIPKKLDENSSLSFSYSNDIRVKALEEKKLSELEYLTRTFVTDDEVEIHVGTMTIKKASQVEAWIKDMRAWA